MSITIKDIAKATGVSYSTVSKALNNSPLVKEVTKKKILLAAQQMGYQPNMMAKSLVSKKSYTIGVAWPTIERAALSSLVTQINEALQAQGYHMVLSINQIGAAVTLFHSLQVDAILVFDEHYYKTHRKPFSSQIPVLFYGALEGYPYVVTGREQAIKKAVHHLSHLGHRHMCYIGDLSEADKGQQEKLNGFKEGLQEVSIQYESYMSIPSYGLEWHHGYQAAKEMLRLFTSEPKASNKHTKIRTDMKDDSYKLTAIKGSSYRPTAIKGSSYRPTAIKGSSYRPTAIISGSYELSSGIIRALKEEGYQIPDDICIISYDNIPQMNELEIPITAVGVSPDVMGKLIVQSLFALMENTSLPPLHPTAVQIIERDSTASF